MILKKSPRDRKIYLMQFVSHPLLHSWRMNTTINNLCPLLFVVHYLYQKKQQLPMPLLFLHSFCRSSKLTQIYYHFGRNIEQPCQGPEDRRRYQLGGQPCSLSISSWPHSAQLFPTMGQKKKKTAAMIRLVLFSSFTFKIFLQEENKRELHD